MCNVKIGFIQSCFLAYLNLMGSWVIVGFNDDDDDDETDKIPNLHLGFCLLVFIPTTLSMMMMMLKVS